VTTVVYSAGTLAADRRVTIGGSICGDSYRKVFTTPDGWLGAWAGGVAAGNEFEAWAKTDRKTKPPTGECIGILVTPKGRVVEYEDGLRIPNPRRSKFHAWGSGAPAALGALHAGADPRKAVLIAQKVDSASGGGVDVVSLPKD
jgi:hypothetical protein